MAPTWPPLYITAARGDCAMRRSRLADVNRAAAPLEAQPCALMQQLWAHALLS